MSPLFNQMSPISEIDRNIRHFFKTSQFEGAQNEKNINYNVVVENFREMKVHNVSKKRSFLKAIFKTDDFYSDDDSYSEYSIRVLISFGVISGIAPSLLATRDPMAQAWSRAC